MCWNMVQGAQQHFSGKSLGGRRKMSIVLCLFLRDGLAKKNNKNKTITDGGVAPPTLLLTVVMIHQIETATDCHILH